jgi:hypothetical protein
MLKQSREDLMQAISLIHADHIILAAANQWFTDIKIWEAQDDFQTALLQNRMTARCTPATAPLKNFQVNAIPVTLDVSMTGMIRRLDPNNFINKQRNLLGLHDLSAVLLRSGLLIRSQLFSLVDKVVVFMPLPMELDLVVFAMLADRAKENRMSNLYNRYVVMRASFTRIKYAADNDMAVSFTASRDHNHAIHVRYGRANIMGGPVPALTLSERSNTVFQYRQRVGMSTATVANNEVNIAYRQHAGHFPCVGVPDPPPADSLTVHFRPGTPPRTLRNDGIIV